MTGWSSHEPGPGSRAGARPGQMQPPMSGWPPPAPAVPERAVRDHDIHALLAAGDRKAALAAMMDAHGRAVFGFCVRVLRDRALAEDVLQRVFLDAYRDLERFQGRSAVAAWLIGIAGHRCQDALKAQRRRLQRLEPDDDALVRIADPGPPPSADVERSRIIAALGDCLAGLSGETRTAILMRFQHGKSYEELSRLLGEKPNTLHARVSRALPLLRRCLEDKGWDDDRT
jgi:RNA polymerase sigma-70 factor, ECF subfamily